MGLMVDTNVFIRFEKSNKPIDFSAWDSSQKVYISALIVSELLMESTANTETPATSVSLRRGRHFRNGSAGIYRPRPHGFMPKLAPNRRRRVRLSAHTI